MIKKDLIGFENEVRRLLGIKLGDFKAAFEHEKTAMKDIDALKYIFMKLGENLDEEIISFDRTKDSSLFVKTITEREGYNSRQRDLIKAAFDRLKFLKGDIINIDRYLNKMQHNAKKLYNLREQALR